jgi:hypothetical protein
MWQLFRPAARSNASAAPYLDADLQQALTDWLNDSTSRGSPQQDTDGGTALKEFVDAQLTTEQDRRNQINARGGGLISTSSGLATLLFTASALITGASKYAPPRLALWGLALAFLTFIAAAFCGLTATRTFKFNVVTPNQLELWRARDDVWHNNKANMLRLLTKANVRTLDSLRAGNNTKMRWVRAGFWAQLGALFALAIAVAAILLSAIFPGLPDSLEIFKPVIHP